MLALISKLQTYYLLKKIKSENTVGRKLTSFKTFARSLSRSLTILFVSLPVSSLIFFFFFLSLIVCFTLILSSLFVALSFYRSLSLSSVCRFLILPRFLSLFLNVSIICLFILLFIKSTSSLVFFFLGVCNIFLLS